MDEQVRDLMHALTADLPHLSQVPPGLHRRARRRVAATVAAGFIVVAVVALGASKEIRALERSQTRVPAHVTPSPSHLTPMVDRLPARLAFTQGGQFALTTLDGTPTLVETSHLRQLDESVEAWMPDGRSFLVTAGGGGGRLPTMLFRIGVDGTNEGSVPSSVIERLNSDSLSPDRTRIAVAQASGLFVEQLDGSSPVEVVSTAVIGGGGGGTLWGPAWSPDGTRIAFAWKGPEAIPKAAQERLFTVNVDGSGLHRLASGGTSPVWSPDGTQLVVQRGSSMYVMDADGTNARLLTSLQGDHPRPSWSPDGSMIAFDWSGDIYVIHPDGTGLAQVTNTPGEAESGALWQPRN
jgi:WD40-like Beta Propeller Repeat